MTKTDFIRSSSRTETESLFVGEIKSMAQLLSVLAIKQSYNDQASFANHALQALRAGWLLAREWNDLTN